MSVATARIVGLDTAGIRRTRAEADGTTDRLPHVVPVAPDLGVVLADDSGALLTEPALRELGWTDDDVVRAAVEVAQQQADGDVAVVRPGTVVVQDPDLAVLLVAAPSSLQGIDLEGAPVLFPVAPTTFILTGADDATGLQTAAGLAAQILADEDGGVLSGPPVVLGSDGWQPFRHDGVDADLRTIRALWTSTAANLQQEALQAVLERRGEDVHVAPVSVARLDDGDAAFAYSAWTEDVETIVAAVDTVVLVTLDGQTLPMPFSRLRELVPGNVDELAVRPVRYRLHGYPDVEGLRAQL
ncbi:hypothetical protein [Curtobacterium sp. MCBA15_001]|uniref:hypothetical protein n=1 Tax=Curtobacterium sp. MCBA15_001 TaxID=1898731 RepID=UPI0008DD392C|nr:hypothetical protein [Curtobacterium sp. MCBA15_001]OIH98192.1 hypothetical protein BIU90_12530 [Curtobacterium sp. MCBA15_001]